MLVARINPYDPNFSKTDARIIDPWTGDSTWTLGSHICKNIVGIFIIKTSINLIYSHPFTFM